MTQSDQIHIQGIEFEANHGWTDEEQKSSRQFRVDVTIKTSLSVAGTTDQLADTVDYQKVCALIVSLGTKTTHRLLETLAASIGNAIVTEFPGNPITITLHKLAPPCQGTPQSCGVTMHF